MDFVGNWSCFADKYGGSADRAWEVADNDLKSVDNAVYPNKKSLQ